MKEHKEIENINAKDEAGKWALNFALHMIDLFDKKRMIGEIKIEDLEYGVIATLTKVIQEKEIYDYKKSKIRYKDDKYRFLSIDKEFLKSCYKYQIEDDTNTTNYLEVILVHEFVHLKYSKHSKRFIREWRRMLKKWLNYKGEDGFDYYNNYFKQIKRFYRK